MQEPQGFCNHETGGRHAYERHGDRFARKLEPSAGVPAEPGVSRIFPRHAFLFGC
jgi:hypothetical protein